MGLCALDIMKNGFFFVHGTNRYSGAAFPGLVAVTFPTMTQQKVGGRGLLTASIVSVYDEEAKPQKLAERALDRVVSMMRC